MEKTIAVEIYCDEVDSWNCEERIYCNNLAEAKAFIEGFDKAKEYLSRPAHNVSYNAELVRSR